MAEETAYMIRMVGSFSLYFQDINCSSYQTTNQWV